jgi:hypothetical protein
VAAAVAKKKGLIKEIPGVPSKKKGRSK